MRIGMASTHDVRHTMRASTPQALSHYPVASPIYGQPLGDTTALAT